MSGDRHKKKDCRNQHKQTAWAAIGSVIALVTFFVIGLLFDEWLYNWLIFLIIPIFYYLPLLCNFARKIKGDYDEKTQ